MTAAAILLWGALAGCGRSAPWTAPDPTPSVFPHAAGYDAPAAHGADALDRGGCAACHDAGQAGPTCASCHADYPHSTKFLAGSAHGAADRDGCAACHEQPGLVATDQSACAACHPTFPHPDGYRRAGQHGAAAQTRASAAATCGPCHGPALAGTATAPGCDDCHAPWPHPIGYAGDPHAQDWRAGTDCAGCHGGATGGPAQVACSRCHAGYPHAEDWGRVHVAQAAAVGAETCLGCHHDPGPDLPGTCAVACHGGAP